MPIFIGKGDVEGFGKHADSPQRLHLGQPVFGQLPDSGVAAGADQLLIALPGLVFLPGLVLGDCELQFDVGQH
jgi:hypothetical protein